MLSVLSPPGWSSRGPCPPSWLGSTPARLLCGHEDPPLGLPVRGGAQISTTRKPFRTRTCRSAEGRPRHQPPTEQAAETWPGSRQASRLCQWGGFAIPGRAGGRADSPSTTAPQGSPTAFSFLPAISRVPRPGLHSGELGPEHTPALATSTPVSWGPMPTMAVTQPAPSPAPSRSGRDNQSCLLCRAGVPAAS